MDLHDMRRERVTVLEMYLEQRRAVKDSLYRMLKMAAEVRVGSEEFKTLADALKLVDSDPWSIRHELENLRKGEK